MAKPAFSSLGGRVQKVGAVFAALLLFGVLAASAASLGGLTSQRLGAGNTLVASCDTDGIALAYTTTYNAASNSYDVTSVYLSSVAPACEGKQFKLTLASSSASLAELSGVVALTNSAFSVPVSPALPSTSVTRSAVVISG